MENTSYTSDQALEFVLADVSEFEELDFDSDYEDEILKKNGNKNSGDQFNPDEEDDFPINTLIQDRTNRYDATTKIFQDSGVNNHEKETVPIYQWRKKDIEYLDVLFNEPTLPSDPYDILSLHEYLKLFVTTEMLQTMPFETKRRHLQCFGEGIRILFTAEDL